MKHYRLEKKNRLAGAIITILGLIIGALQCTGNMTWLTTLPSVLLVVATFLPWIMLIGGTALYVSDRF